MMSMSSGSALLRFVAACLLWGALTSPVHAQGASTWFLAEGASNGTFDEDILVGNPSATALTVTVKLLPSPDAVVAPGMPLEKAFVLPATGRLTVNLKREFSGLNGATSAQVSAVVHGTVTPADIVVERSMFFPLSGTPYAGGTGASGVVAPATRWILAEGASGVFSTFILIANPGTSPAAVTARYLKGDGTTFTETRTIEPGSRDTLWPSELPALAQQGFSTVVESDQPVVAERAMYFDDFRSGHDALGLTTGRTSWYFAEGFTGGNSTIAFETFLLVGNDNDTPAVVTATYFRDSGSPITREYTVLPRSRFNIWTDQEKDEQGALLLPSTAFSVRLDSTIPIVAERAMYWGTPSSGDPTTPSFPWKEGHVVAGIEQPESAWAFAEGRQGDDPSGVAFDSFFLLVNPTGSDIDVRATFATEDGTGVQTIVHVTANTRTNLWPAVGAGPDQDTNAKFALLQGRRFAVFLESVGGQAFVAERAMYWSNYTGGHANAGSPWAGPIIGPASAPVDVTVSGMSPGSGRLSGGTVVTITGTNFGPSPQVRFAGTTVPAAVNPAGTQITFTVPLRSPATGFGVAGPTPVSVTAQGRFVRAPSFTRYFSVLTFGDSLTWGTSNSYDVGGVRIPVNIQRPYPRGVKNALESVARFGPYTLVTNAGWQGEWVTAAGFNSAPPGVVRFPNCTTVMTNCFSPQGGNPSDRLSPHDVTVILEGVNDLNNQVAAGFVVAGVKTMVTDAKSKGLQVLLLLFGPYGTDQKTREPATDAALIRDYNRRLDELAAEQGVSREYISAEMSPDGLHPNQTGYDQMASAVFNKLLTMFPRCPNGQTSCP